MGKTSVKIKRPLWVVGLNIALALTVGSTQAFATEINSVEDLLAVSGVTNYVLMVDLDLSNDDASSAEGEQRADVETLGAPSYISNGFTGRLDGGGRTISGLTKPLFDTIAGIGSTEISNLTLEADTVGVGVTGQGILANEVNTYTLIDNVHVIGNVIDIMNTEVGGLVGVSDGNITNSSATGNVSGTNGVGGLVGLSGGDISNSYATGGVGGVGDYVGGLVGYSAGTITNSYATSSVGGVGDYVGGLVGSSAGTITNSYATGSVGGEGAFSVGGLVGSNNGDISNSYAAGGSVIGYLEVGGLAGANSLNGNIERSYSHNTVTGLGELNNDIGGLVGYNSGEILGSYAISTVTGEREVGGLVGENFGFVTNSYTTGYVTGDTNVGGLIGYNEGNITNSYAEATVSYAEGTVYGDGYLGGLIGNYNTEFVTSEFVTYSFSVNNYNFEEFRRTAYSDQCADEEFVVGVDCGENISPFPSVLQVINTGLEDTFAYDNCINSGIPYLVPLINSYSNGCEDLTSRISFSYLLTQVLDSLSKSVGFAVAKSDLSKLDLALLDQVKGDKSAQIIGSKLFANQSLSTSLSVGSLLQLEINFEANKSLQMWVKSSDGQYVLLGDITFDKDGNAVLPGIEFKKSGQYELIFVNSDKKDLTQPELINKVIGLTVYVN